MSNPHYYQTRSTKKINQTTSELSSNLLFTRKMASSSLYQSTATSDTSQQNNDNQEENPILKSRSLQYKQKNVSLNEQTDIKEKNGSSVSSMNSKGFDLPTSTSPIPQHSSLNSNVNNERKSDESTCTSLHVPLSTTTFDQNFTSSYDRFRPCLRISSGGLFIFIITRRL